MARTNSSTSSFRQLATTGLLFIPLLGAIAAVNAIVDPAKIIHEESYAAGVAGILASGRSVARAGNLNERLLQREYVRTLSAAPDTIILGSSRTQAIGRGSLAGCGEIHNSSVSGAVLADDLAIYGLYRRRKLTPKTVVLGVDPWLFNEGLGDEGPYLSLSESYLAMSSTGAAPAVDFRLRLAAMELRLDKALQFVSPTYFQASLRALASGANASYLAVPDDAPTDDAVILSDGSTRESLAARSLPPESVRRSAVAYANEKNVYDLYAFDSVSPRLRSEFEGFVDLLRSDGIRVVLYLPPYHPAVYPELLTRPDTRIIRDVELYLRDFASGRGIALVGSYDPGPLAAAEGDFHDGMHLTREGVGKIFLHRPICSGPGMARR